MNPRKSTRSNVFIELFDKYPREYFVAAFFVLFYLAIIWETFSYTVLNHDFYENLAYKQQVGEVEIPVTRGTIYSLANNTMKQGTVISTSVDLNDIAIDPQIEGDKGKLATFLTDILYKEMCYLKDSGDCYIDLLRFLRVLEIQDFSTGEEYVKDKIKEKITEKISKTKVTSVRVRETLSPEDEVEIIGWNIPGVYASVNGLYVNPEELINPDFYAEKYIGLFGGSRDKVLYQVRQRDLRYVPIYQKLSLLVSDEIGKYISDERRAISEGIIDSSESIYRFLILAPHAQRIYPERQVGSQIIGFLDNAGKGHYGLEGYYDDILKGNPGELVRKKDIKGRSIDPISFGKDNIDALEGVDIRTTIDRNIQRKVEKILEQGVKKYRANKGTVVVLEPKTGRILSLANYPSYDPNNPGEVYELKKVNYSEYPNPETDLLGKGVFVEDIERGEAFIYDGKQIYLSEATREDYVDYEKTKYIYKNEFGAGVYSNDAISGLYEPGSIMKTVTVAAGIDSGEIKPFDFYNDTGKLTIDNFTIRNVDDDCLGYNTFQNALNYSCNVGMIRIVQKLGKALVHKYFTDFGFGEATGITLEGEVSSKIEPYEKWSTAKLLTSSYGLGVSLTPLQMAGAYSTIANEGIYMKPYIVESIEYSDGKVISYEPQATKRVIKQSTAKSVVNMLVSSVDDGVAGNGAVEGYSIAGKTGTSQIAYRGKYETGPASTNGSFAGFDPAEDPQFTILVKLERPRTSQYGGATSAYIFSEIASELLEYYGIPKKN